MELKRDLIIKALECCQTNSEMDCIECPYRNKGNYYLYAGCVNMLTVDALSLIKELTEKVENYRNELGEVRVALAEANNDKRKLTEENERLSDRNRTCVYLSDDETKEYCVGLCPAYVTPEEIIADTVRKMQEKIHEKSYTNNYCQEVVLLSDIDKIVEELKEETN